MEAQSGPFAILLGQEALGHTFAGQELAVAMHLLNGFSHDAADGEQLTTIGGQPDSRSGERYTAQWCPSPRRTLSARHAGVIGSTEMPDEEIDRLVENMNRDGHA